MKKMSIIADKRNAPLLLRPVVRVSHKRSSLVRCHLVVSLPGRQPVQVVEVRMEQN